MDWGQLHISLPVASGKTTLFNLNNLVLEHIILKPQYIYTHTHISVSMVYTYVCIKTCVEMPEEGIKCPPLSLLSTEAGSLPVLETRVLPSFLLAWHSPSPSDISGSISHNTEVPGTWGHTYLHEFWVQTHVLSSWLWEKYYYPLRYLSSPHIRYLKKSLWDRYLPCSLVWPQSTCSVLWPCSIYFMLVRQSSSKKGTPKISESIQGKTSSPVGMSYPPLWPESSLSLSG